MVKSTIFWDPHGFWIIWIFGSQAGEFGESCGRPYLWHQEGGTEPNDGLFSWTPGTLIMGWYGGDLVGIWRGTQEYWVYNGITGWWFGTYCIFPYIGKNHPNWRTHIFQRGSNHQPVTYIVRILERYCTILDMILKKKDVAFWKRLCGSRLSTRKDVTPEKLNLYKSQFPWWHGTWLCRQTDHL